MIVWTVRSPWKVHVSKKTQFNNKWLKSGENLYCVISHQCHKTLINWVKNWQTFLICPESSEQHIINIFHLLKVIIMLQIPFDKRYGRDRYPPLYQDPPLYTDQQNFFIFFPFTTSYHELMPLPSKSTGKICTVMQLS